MMLLVVFYLSSIADNFISVTFIFSTRSCGLLAYFSFLPPYRSFRNGANLRGRRPGWLVIAALLYAVPILEEGLFYRNISDKRKICPRLETIETCKTPTLLG